MTWTLLVAIIVIAIFDSLNPSLFVAQLYLLTTPRPVPRVLAYIVGVLAVNFLGGLLVLGGLRTLFVGFVQSLDPNLFYAAELTLGVVLIGFGLWMRLKPNHVEAPKPRSLSIGNALLLGGAVMINELTTALPYFVAIERLAQAELSLGWNVFALVVYNVVFGLPLFGFLFGYLAVRQRFIVQIERINRGVAYWMPRIIKYGSIIFGGVLVAHAMSFFAMSDMLAT